MVWSWVGVASLEWVWLLHSVRVSEELFQRWIGIRVGHDFIIAVWDMDGMPDVREQPAKAVGQGEGKDGASV